jgi:hypothetical protein
LQSSHESKTTTPKNKKNRAGHAEGEEKRYCPALFIAILKPRQLHQNLKPQPQKQKNRTGYAEGEEKAMLPSPVSIKNKTRREYLKFLLIPYQINETTR